MKRLIAICIGLACAFLTACSSGAGEQDNAEGTKPDDVKELVSEYSAANSANVSAVITSEELILTDENNSEKAYDLPENEFFVSIAPYVHETHP
nr:hypothetical protein [Bacillus piscicola]